MIIDYVERYKYLFGVEPICTTLTDAGVPIAPSTFYAARTRPPSARAVRDEDLKAVIVRVHGENYGVYGIRKNARTAQPRRGTRRLPVGGTVHHAAVDERPGLVRHRLAHLDAAPRKLTAVTARAAVRGPYPCVPACGAR
jgi:hypothetical protein